MAKVILIVEDEKRFGTYLSEAMKAWYPNHEVIWVQDQISACRIFNEQQGDIALIMMDACVPGHTPNTHGLVQYIRNKNWAGPMIACSSDLDYAEGLVRDGCTAALTKHAFISNKKGVKAQLSAHLDCI